MFSRDLARIPWSVPLILQALAGTAWIVLMPGGFPVGHLRFLANRGIPAVVIVMALVGLHAGFTVRRVRLHAVMATLSAGWGMAAITGLALFPISARLLFPVALGVSLLFALPTLRPAAREDLRSRMTLALVPLGALLGVLSPFTQRAELPATRPIHGMPSMAMAEGFADSPESVTLAKHLRVNPREGSLLCLRDRYVMHVNPLLTFISQSPDRCWTLFAPNQRRIGQSRILSRWSRDDSGLVLAYRDEGTSELRVREMVNDGAQWEANSQIGTAIYSHLNTFCEVAVSGHERLTLRFSPCGEVPLEVLPMDYPVGRPARFAYLDAGGVFRVVEASSGEKGPFRELASGPLRRGQPLQITFLDAGRPYAVLVLDDWSSQLSTALSPTAGWGVPENAIEFALEGSSPRSGANLFITLASTSVGRGFDSVGHAPGTYRNRASIRMLPR